MFGGDDGLAWTPSPSVLSIKARMLKQTKQKEAKAEPVASDLEPLTNLYLLHEGDLEKIFSELGDHPGKALKYPPANAVEFAEKYIGGYYTYVDMKKISAKISMKRAALITEGNLMSFLTSEPVSKPRPVNVEAREAQKAKEAEATNSMTTGLEKLYNDKNGDIEAIFAVLGEDPGKALKYPPSDAKAFATKYLEGGYTYVEVRKQPSKPKVAAAVGMDPMVKGFADLYTQHNGDIEAIFAVLGENPGKALKYPPADAHTFATKYINGGYTYAASHSTKNSAAAEAPASPSKNSGDPMIAALEALYEKHGGDLGAIFEVLGEDPKKAIKYPPKDANEFATKYLSGAYTYYTAPEESEESVAARMEAQDEALTPMEVLLMLFPDVEVSLLEAAFQEANGHLEQTVELLLTAMFFSSLETNQAQVETNTDMDASFLAVQAADMPPPPPPGAGNGMQAGVSELSKFELDNKTGEDMMDQVLALTVPPGAVAGDLVRFVTPAGAIVAEVPEGVEEGQPFFVRLQPLM
jgi:hypothetical protein